MVINSINEVYEIGFEKIKNKKEYFNSLYSTFEKIKVFLEENKEGLAVEQAEETGKPIKYCGIEVERCILQLDQAIEYLSFLYTLNRSRA